MISTVKKVLDQRTLKKNLLMFLAEAEKNLELYYVADQRQFITQKFLLQSWGAVKELDIVKKHAAIGKYIQSIESFNRLFDEYKAYEQWYSSDMKNKNAENAKKLHGLKHDLDLKLKSMEVVIIPAGQVIEQEMLQLGLLKV